MTLNLWHQRPELHASREKIYHRANDIENPETSVPWREFGASGVDGAQKDADLGCEHPCPLPKSFPFFFLCFQGVTNGGIMKWATMRICLLDLLYSDLVKLDLPTKLSNIDFYFDSIQFEDFISTCHYVEGQFIGPFLRFLRDWFLGSHFAYFQIIFRGSVSPPQVFCLSFHVFRVSQMVVLWNGKQWANKWWYGEMGTMRK